MKKYMIAITGLLLIAHPAFAEDIQYNLRVDGMTCPFCAATSEKVLKKIDGVHGVSTNLDEGVIHVCADNVADLNDKKLKKLLKKQGFTYVSKTSQQICALEETQADPNAKPEKKGFWGSLFHRHS